MTGFKPRTACIGTNCLVATDTFIDFSDLKEYSDLCNISKVDIFSHPGQDCEAYGRYEWSGLYEKRSIKFAQVCSVHATNRYLWFSR